MILDGVLRLKTNPAKAIPTDFESCIHFKQPEQLFDIFHCFVATQGRGGNTTLASIQQRKAWEAQFDRNYIKPTFDNNRVNFLCQK